MEFVNQMVFWLFGIKRDKLRPVDWLYVAISSCILIMMIYLFVVEVPNIYQSNLNCYNESLRAIAEKCPCVDPALRAQFGFNDSNNTVGVWTPTGWVNATINRTNFKTTPDQALLLVNSMIATPEGQNEVKRINHEIAIMKEGNE